MDQETEMVTAIPVTGVEVDIEVLVAGGAGNVGVRPSRRQQVEQIISAWPKWSARRFAG
jgi:hypothetical protein